MLRIASVLLTVCAVGPLQAQDSSLALFSQGRNDEAMRALETQVGTNPFDPVSMNNLAAVKAAHQDWNAAAALLVRAHRLAPSNAVIGSNLDQLNAWLSRDSKAVRADAAGQTGDAVDELPPEPPALWSPAAASAPRTQAKQPSR